MLCKTWPRTPYGSSMARAAGQNIKEKFTMNTQKWKHLLLGMLLLIGSQSALRAQNYSINWFKVSGGGGTSAGGNYSVSGTIGQQDAGGAMTGGNYSLTGGFWSLVAVAQTAGLPNLAITRAGNSIIVSWPDTGSYTLQQNTNLAAPAGWIKSLYPILSANGTNSIMFITPATGNLFFRLANP
jgi:hypothetical protein